MFAAWTVMRPGEKHLRLRIVVEADPIGCHAEDRKERHCLSEEMQWRHKAKAVS